MQFFESSPKSVEVKRGRKVGDRKYPWLEVPPGKSFAVPCADIKFAVLRSLASKTGKKLHKKFRVINHGEGLPYEVACIPQSREEIIASGPTLIEALDKLKGNDGE